MGPVLALVRNSVSLQWTGLLAEGLGHAGQAAGGPQSQWWGEHRGCVGVPDLRWASQRHGHRCRWDRAGLGDRPGLGGQARPGGPARAGAQARAGGQGRVGGRATPGGPARGGGQARPVGTGQGWGTGQARGTGQGWGTGQARGPGQGWGTGLAGSGWAWARTCPLQRGRPALPEASAYFRSISDQGSGLGPAWQTSPCPVPALTTSSHQAHPVGPGPCPHSGRAPAQGHPPCAGWRPSHHKRLGTGLGRSPELPAACAVRVGRGRGRPASPPGVGRRPVVPAWPLPGAQLGPPSSCPTVPAPAVGAGGTLGARGADLLRWQEAWEPGQVGEPPQGQASLSPAHVCLWPQCQLPLT